MMKQISPKIWIPVIVVILIAVALAIFFAWPEKEKVPEEVTAPEVTPTPEITPEEEITPPEGIAWNIPEGQVDPEIEKEIKRVIYEDPYFISLAGDLKKENELISFESITVEGKCATIGYAFMYQEPKEYIPTAGVTLVLKNVNGKWEKVGTFVYDFDIDYSQCRVIEGYEE